jgi:hypothetical protein
MSPFVARTIADRALLAACVLLLFGAWWAMRSLADRPSRVLFLVTGGAFLGFLAARALVIGLAAFALALVVRASLRGPPGFRGRGASQVFASVGALLLAAAFVLGSTPAPVVATEVTAAEETQAALDRGNLFEARLWAERWAGESPDGPTDAALLLAQIDWELGHRERALSIAADVSARGVDEDLRRRASERLAAWRGAP